MAGGARTRLGRTAARMKIAVMSDLHLELDLKCASQPAQGTASGTSEFSHKPPQPRADLLIVAGDIYSGDLGIDWVLRHFSMPAIIIGGNHEPYGHELFRVIQINRERAQATNGRVTFLERATWERSPAGGEKVRISAPHSGATSGCTARPPHPCRWPKRNSTISRSSK
ncbi:metallophosphoesterase [Rhodopila sp.]|uniref:metallophosphoesterase n=1 Tax=Rhodopila sp. TaxID=2480087 RepID=UPI0038D08132